MMPSFRFGLRMLLALFALLFSAGTAAAQWTRVTGVKETSVFSLAQRGDTLLAGTDDTVYVSLNGGASWKASGIGTTSTPINAVRVERGLLWAGTRGSGVRTSANAGASWQNASAGLSGLAGLFISAFESRGDSLYAGTEGAGTFVKRLSTLGPWTLFGPSIVNSASGTVTAFKGEGQRLMVSASPNGIVAYNDRGVPDWTQVALEPPGVPSAGLEMTSFAWTGSAWLTAGNGRIYRSPTGTSDWTQVGPPVGCCLFSKVVSGDGLTFASFSRANGGAAFFFSADGGVTWTFLESQPAVAIDLMLRDSFLYAGRVDGLWRRSVATLEVPPPTVSSGAEFALAGPNPMQGATAVRFALSAAGRVRVTALDVSGRVVATLTDAEFPAGPQRVTWDASALPPGVYSLQFETPGARRSLRVVLVR